MLLDEPSMGWRHGDPADLQDHHRDQQTGTTILLVEQNAQQALSGLRGLHLGNRESSSLAPAELLATAIKEAYLGVA